MLHKQNDYIVLSLRECIDYFEQLVYVEFRKSVDWITSKAEKIAGNADGDTVE